MLAAAFGAVELRLARRGAHPLLDVRLFADPNFATGVAAIVILFGATFGFFYIGMQYVQQIMGYSALTTAIAFGPFMVPLGIFSALSFWYVPKLGLRLVLSVGTLLMAIGFACMYRLNLHSSYTEFAWPTLVLATGIGICTAPTTSAIMGAVPDEKQGVASAVNDTSREMGGALGIAVAGSILAGRYSHELAPKLAGFPAPVRGPATDSLAKAVEVAGRMAPGPPAGAAQQDRVPGGLARVDHHDGRHRRPRRGADRRVGTRSRRPAVTAGARAAVPPPALTHSKVPMVLSGIGFDGFNTTGNA